MTSDPKMPTLGSLFKIWEYLANVHLMVQLKSGGQELPVIRKERSKVVLTIKKSSFLPKVL